MLSFASASPTPANQVSIPRPNGPSRIRELSAEWEFYAAATVVVKEYFAKGYITTQNPWMVSRMAAELRRYRMLGFWRNSQLQTVVGLCLGKVLPMDAIFASELNQLRREGLRVGEIGKLAGPTSLPVLLALMTAVVVRAQEETDVLAIMVNPAHIRFYRDIAGFDFLHRTPRPYPGVNNALAYGLYAEPRKILALPRAQRSLQALHRCA